MRKYILIVTVAAVVGMTACAGTGNSDNARTVSAVFSDAETSDKDREETPLDGETEHGADEKYLKESTAGTQETVEPLPMLYAQGRLYRLLSELEEPMGDADAVTGYIQSSVGQGEAPAEEGQSNFGEIGNPYCLDEAHGELVSMINDVWLRFTAVDLEVSPVDLDSISEPAELLGADGIELNYIGDGIIVFHSFAGVFVCEWTEDGWVLNQTLDLAPLEANVTQGDNFTMIKTDGQVVWISPKCYAPDNKIPVTYRYLIAENRLELAGRFQEKEDMHLKWSYSEEAMARRETIYHKLAQRGLLLSNLYPVLYMDSEVYGFIAVDSGAAALSPPQYGRYWEASGKLELEPIKW